MYDSLAAWARLLHAVSLALWAGGAIFFSYAAAPRIFGHLRDRLPADPPPELSGVTSEVGQRLAGDVVASIFPTYFTAQLIAGGLALVSGVVLAQGNARGERVRLAIVSVATLTVVVHTATVYRWSVAARAAQHRAQMAGELERAAALASEFGMWHGISQLLNLTTIVLVMLALVLALDRRSTQEQLGSPGQTGPSAQP